MYRAGLRVGHGERHSSIPHAWPTVSGSFVRRRPVPFPPEPVRTGVIELTRNRMAAADRNQGQRGIWLRTLDRLGLGFDS